MGFDEDFDEDDEHAGLLQRGHGGGGQKSAVGRPLGELASLLGSLPPQAKLCLAAVLSLAAWRHFRGTTVPGAVDLQAAPQGTPAPKPLKANGDEVRWAEDAFGVYFSKAIPRLEGANTDLQNFLNLLSQDQCDSWVATLADNGTYSFSLPHLTGEFRTRDEVRRAFCTDPVLKIAAVKLVWHFPDLERKSGLALYEVFWRAGSGQAVRKQRWAHYAAVGADLKLSELRLHVESADRDAGKVPQPILEGTVVQANLLRLNDRDCGGFAAALPLAGAEDWVLQSLPDGLGLRDELDASPREQVLAKCRRDVESDWSNIDFQLASIAGVFPGADRTTIVFFHKEKRFKGTMDVTDDPEALIVRFEGDPAASYEARHLMFYHVEGVHLVQEWGWKYGSASHGQR